jgi:hypothetical protein
MPASVWILRKSSAADEHRLICDLERAAHAGAQLRGHHRRLRVRNILFRHSGNGASAQRADAITPKKFWGIPDACPSMPSPI